MKLQGRVALITGAGSGFGNTIAVEMAKEGAKIAVNDVNAQAIEETLAEVRGAGSEGLAFQADVGNVEQVKCMLETLKSAWGSLDILVNNAGIGISPK